MTTFNRMLGVLVGGTLAGAATIAAAQEGPSFDCGRASGEVETLICNDPELSRLDRTLAGHYGEAIKAAEGLDAGAEEAVAELKAYQRGWIKGRNDCWKADDVQDCIKVSYQMRDAELIATWFLQQPFNTAVWACGGNPANEVTTAFFKTELPSVRFERGDSVDVGFETRTGSGARYDGSFGRYIWMKGDEATYRDPDPDGTEYQCTLVSQG